MCKFGQSKLLHTTRTCFSCSSPLLIENNEKKNGDSEFDELLNLLGKEVKMER